MEIQFQKRELTHLTQVVSQVQDQEQTQEVRLPDTMPDIGHVIASRGQILIRNKQWNNGSMSAGGGVMVWVLYKPEDRGGVQWVEAWVPFQVKWDLPETKSDGCISVYPILKSLETRNISARKLLVRACVSLHGEATVSGQTDLFDVPELPQDIQLQKKTCVLQLPTEAGEKTVNMDENISLPGEFPALEKIVCYSVQPVICEKKVLSDKAVFRGTANLHMMYMDIEEKLHCWEFEMPFSQYTELEKEHSADAFMDVCLCMTSLELEKGEGGNMKWKTGIAAQYKIYDPVTVDMITDAYSPHRKVTPVLESIPLPNLLQETECHCDAAMQFDVDGAEVTEKIFFPRHVKTYRENGMVTVELSGIFQVLCLRADSELLCMEKRWEDKIALESGRTGTRTEAVLLPGQLQLSWSGGNAQLNVQMPLQCRIFGDVGLPIVSGIVAEDSAVPDPDRPSLILMSAGKESLWDIAKKAGSSVQKILEANGLDEEPESGRMLLIPVI